MGRGVALGDGVAAIPGMRSGLVTACRTFVESVHFDLLYLTPRELGARSVTIAVADLAPRNAKPRCLSLTLGVRQDTHEFFVEEFFRGAEESARAVKAKIVAAQTVSSPQVVLIQVAVMADGPSRQPARRPKPGDVIAVTGSLGASAAGLNCLKKIGRHFLQDHEAIVRAHVAPAPRLDVAALGWRNGVTGMRVLSDGLAKDLHGLLAGATGALIHEERLPIADTTVRGAELVNASAKHWALYGGEDYELLLTAPPSRLKALERGFARADAPLSVIGEVRPRSFGIRVRARGGNEVELAPQRYHDFVRRFRKVGQGE